jgi:DNA-binding NarL/FixJ family response regulator
MEGEGGCGVLGLFCRLGQVPGRWQMESIHNGLRDSWNNKPYSQLKCSILIVDNDDLALRKSRNQLTLSGFKDVETRRSVHSAQQRISERCADIIFLDIVSEKNQERGFEFLSRLHARKSRGVVVVISAQPSFQLLYRAAMSGASEFLVKTLTLDLSKEIPRLLDKRRMNDFSLWQPDAFLRSGVFQSMGLSKGEIETLGEFACGFPRHREIANRLGKNSTYIRKTFSRIYEKVGSYFPVDNPAQLSHLITICSLFH